MIGLDRSLIGLPNTQRVCESLVAGSRMFRYWSMGCCRTSVFRLPSGFVLLVMSCLTVLTPISDLQFDGGGLQTTGGGVLSNP